LRSHLHQGRRIARRLRRRRSFGSQAIVSADPILGLRGALSRLCRMAHLRSGCLDRHPEGRLRPVFFLDGRGVAGFARAHQALQQRGEPRLRSCGRRCGLSRRSGRCRAARFLAPRAGRPVERVARESRRRRLADGRECLWSEGLHAVSIADRRPNGARTFFNRLPRPSVARDCHAACPRQETVAPPRLPVIAHRPLFV
jgi:hypothetical protein